MDTRSAASLTNGSGEFFLVQVALGGPGHGEVLVEMHADSSLPYRLRHHAVGRTLVMGHAGASIALAAASKSLTSSPASAWKPSDSPTGFTLERLVIRAVFRAVFTNSLGIPCATISI